MMSRSQERNLTEAEGRSLRETYYQHFADILNSGDAGEGPNERERAILGITPRPCLEPPAPTLATDINSPPPLPYLARSKPIWCKYLIDLCDPKTLWKKETKTVQLGEELVKYHTRYVLAVSEAQQAWEEDLHIRNLEGEWSLSEKASNWTDHHEVACGT